MKKPLLFLFFFFTGIALVQAQTTGSLVLKSAVSKLKNSREYTLKVAAAMPAEAYGFKPTPEEMSFGAQLLHLSSNLAWLCTAYLGGAANPITKEEAALTEKASIIAVVEKTYAYALTVLEQFPESQLADEVKFFAGPLSKLQILTLVNDHQTHHRAQLLVYLRLNGVAPPAYTGW